MAAPASTQGKDRIRRRPPRKRRAPPPVVFPRWARPTRSTTPHRLLRGVALGPGVRVYSFTNLYGCAIGAGSRISTFVEVQSGVRIGANCKISSHTFICEGVTIEDGVFVGHGVTFVNDRRPRATAADGSLQSAADWTLEETVVEEGASIGSGATILGGVRIGPGALVGAGAVVTRDVAAGQIVVGNPGPPLGEGSKVTGSLR